MTRLVPSAEMTLGPFFPREFAQGVNDLAEGAKGEVIEIVGRVTQLDGKPLDNLLIEIWQADSAGRFDNPAFAGWGRAATDAQGNYRFRAIKPGAAKGRAPHVNFLLLYSGLMRHLQTAMFFSDAADPVLDSVSGSRKKLLIGKNETANTWRFDIRLRGDGETPFFED